MEEQKDTTTVGRGDNDAPPDNTVPVSKPDGESDNAASEVNTAGAGKADAVQKSASKRKAKKVISIVLNVLFYSFIAVFLVIGVFSVIGKAQGKNNGLSVFGYNFYVVSSSSMARVNEEHADFLKGHNDRIQYDAKKGYGDLIITKAIPKDYKLKLYDVVTYSTGKLVIVHRIVEIKEVDGKTMYLTRGDSNNSDDGWRTKGQFTGILVKNAGMGWANIIRFLQSGYGIAALFGAMAILLGAILFSTVLDDKAKKKKAAEAAIASDTNGSEPDSDMPQAPNSAPEALSAAEEAKSPDTPEKSDAPEADDTPEADKTPETNDAPENISAPEANEKADAAQEVNATDTQDTDRQGKEQTSEKKPKKSGSSAGKKQSKPNPDAQPAAKKPSAKKQTKAKPEATAEGSHTTEASEAPKKPKSPNGAAKKSSPAGAAKKQSSSGAKKPAAKKSSSNGAAKKSAQNKNDKANN